jgi:hypothetical protein
MIYVTVCKNTILSNLKRGENKAPLRVSKGKHGKPRRRHQQAIRCVSCGAHVGLVVVRMKRPLPWGARAWVEITS